MISAKYPVRALALGLALAGSTLAAAPVLAQEAFGEIDKAAQPNVRFAASDNGSPIQAGSEVVISGSDFRPGQKVSLHYGATALTSAPLVADAEGTITGTLTLPADATVGIHPIVVWAEGPYHALVAELKVSPNVPLFGQDAFEITTAQPTRGLYQSAYSARNNTVFVTSAIGRPPVRQSELVKLDADTLEVLARVTPQAAPDRPGRDGQMQDGGVFAVYGIGLDDSRETIWVTNSRQDTIAVYRQSDLGLIKQFAPGVAEHARDVLVDEDQGKAFVSATFTNEVLVFDTATNEQAETITISSRKRGEDFGVASLSLDPAAHRLYVASLASAEVAVIDTSTNAVLNVFDVPGARNVIGIAHDPETGRIFVAAQGSDNLVVLDGESGEVIADTPVGAGALNVAFDPLSRRAFVTNRGANSITVTDADGKIVANLGPAERANHVAPGAPGTLFAVDKSAGAREADADRLLRIRQPR